MTDVAGTDVMRAMTGHPRCNESVSEYASWSIHCEPTKECGHWVSEHAMSVRAEATLIGVTKRELQTFWVARPLNRCAEHSEEDWLLNAAFDAALNGNHYVSHAQLRNGRQTRIQMLDQVSGDFGERALAHFRRCMKRRCSCSGPLEAHPVNRRIKEATLVVARRLISKDEL